MLNTSIKLVSVAITSALLLSCSNNSDLIKKNAPVRQSQNNESHVAVKSATKIESIKKCKQTQRDLSLTWEQRKYWCTYSGRVVSFENRNREYVELVNTVAKSSRNLNKVQSSLENTISEMEQDKSVILEKNHKITTASLKNTSAITPIQAVYVKKQVPLSNVKPVIKESSEVAYLPSINTEDAKKVWFTNEIEYLDSSNQHIALSLLPDAKLAKKVILRGHIQAGEVVSDDEIEFERFSVGRSLSIKKLFIEKGVDQSKIKILHFRSNPEGRYVEVKFHG